ncbi:MAG: hypothetical protein ACRCTA_05915, partial [Bacilli bacterium]
INKIHQIVDEVYSSLQGQQLEEIISSCGFTLLYKELMMPNDPRALTSIIKGQKEVMINQQSITMLYEASTFYNLKLTLNQVLELHLAHEVFHVVEYTNKISFEQLLQPFLKKRFFKNNINDYLTEIGCFYFALLWTNTKIHPLALEQAYQLYINQESRNDFNE